MDIENESSSSELLFDAQPRSSTIAVEDEEQKVMEDDEKKVIEDVGVNAVQHIMERRPRKWDFLGKRGRSRKRQWFKKVDPSIFSSKHSIPDQEDENER